MTPSNESIGVSAGSKESLLAASPEIVLFIAGGILTILVVAFVVWLMLHAIREDQAVQAAKKAKRSETEGDS